MRAHLFILIGTLLAHTVSGQSLKELTSAALEHDPATRQAYANFEAAMSRSAKVARLPDPSLSFGVFVLPIETRVGPQQAKVGLSQMFPWFGTLKAKGDAVALQAESAFMAYENEKAQVVKTTSVQYYELYRNSRLQAIKASLIGLLESMEEITRSRYEQSLGSLADVYRTQLALKKAQGELDALQEEELGLRAQLNILTGSPADRALVLDTILDFPSSELLVDSFKIQGHPRIVSSEIMIRSTAAEERAAKRSGYPMIGVGLDYVMVGKRQDAPVMNSGRDAIVPMASISLPIHRKGIRAAQEEARHRQAYFRAKGEVEADRLRGDLVNANAHLRSSTARYRSAQLREQDSRELVELLLASYSAGEAPYEELLREQINLVKVKEEKLHATVDHLIQETTIEYVTYNVSSNE